MTETLVEMCSGSGVSPRYYVHLGSSAADSDFHTFLPELLLQQSKGSPMLLLYVLISA